MDFKLLIMDEVILFKVLLVILIVFLFVVWIMFIIVFVWIRLIWLFKNVFFENLFGCVSLIFVFKICFNIFWVINILLCVDIFIIFFFVKDFGVIKIEIIILFNIDLFLFKMCL